MADMGSDLNPPPWLPSERWEDLLILSMVAGPLSSLCVEVARKSSLWEEWYKSDYPDLEKLPCETTENKDPIIKVKDENESIRLAASPDRSPYSEFHMLLILRVMRPDRIPDALSQYVKKHVSDLVLNGAGPDIDDISNLDENTLGILVLLQPQQCSSQPPSYESTVINLVPTHAICTSAKERSIPVCVISMKSGYASEIKASLDDMWNQDGWLIIENLQLASETVIEDLHQNMLYAKKMKEPQNEDSHFCVWLTTEPGGLIPQQLLTSLKKVSWHVFVPKHITKMAVLGPLTALESPALLMEVGILSALDEVNDELYLKLKVMQLNTRIICFGVCILHGILIVLRALPGTGLNHLLTVGHEQLNQAIKAVLAYSQKSQTTQADLLQVLEDTVSTVYTNLTTGSEDVLYIQALTHNIFSQCQQQRDSFDIGGLTIPVPSANVEPQQYSSWLSEKLPEGFSVGEPLLPRRIERAANEAHGIRYLQSLSDMLNAMQVGFPPANPQREKSAKEMFSLRRALDILSEQLPPPLEVGSLNTDASSYLPPYHRATDAGIPSEDKNQPPETIGYCLLQECYWMNASMCYIRKQVTWLSKYMVACSFAVPDHLSQSARALKKGEVPKAWLHPNCWPTAHTLLSWLADLQQKHIQLKQWLKKGLMPFAKGDKGALNAIRPGGLVNPEALFIALRYEYALQHGHLMDEVVLHCQISEYPDYKPEAQGYQLYLEGLYLHNATWDFRQNHLKESRDELVPLPFVTVTPVYHMDVKYNEEEIEIYECPLYLDNTKQFCVLKMPLPCPKPVYQWHLQRVAIILNPEPDAFFPPKCNSFVNSKAKERRQHTMAMNTRAMTDRSFYSKLFHPPSDWMYHDDIQSLTLNPDIDADNVLNFQEIGSANVKDKLGSQVENTDSSMDLQEHQETEEITDNLMLLSPSSDREPFDTGADHGESIDYHKSHQIFITGSLLDLQGIGSANVKGKLESQVENMDCSMDLQEDQETIEVTDTLMLISPSGYSETFDTGADHSDTFDYHKSDHIINGTTSVNNYQGENPETEIESERDLSLERDKYAQSGRGQEALVDNDQNEATGQKSSSPVTDDDYNEEGFENADYAEGYKSRDGNSDTSEEEDRNLGSDHGDVNNYGGTTDKSMNNENNLNMNADGQDDSDDDIYDDDDDFDKPGSNLADRLSLRNSAVSHEKEGENGLGNDVDHEIHQTKRNSFLGLLSESRSDSDSENDYNF